MSTPQKPITIIGGMGPQASSRLYTMVMRKSTQHPGHAEGVFPHVILRSIAIEDFISDSSKQTKGKEILMQAAAAAAKDASCVVAIACNTAHLFAADVARVCGAPFASMIDLVSSAVAAEAITGVGLLASPTTIRTNLYASALSKRGVECLVPSPKDQRQLESIIRAVLAEEATPQQAGQLQTIAQDLVHKGAQGIILGCTELPLIFPKDSLPCPIFDSLEIMSCHLVDKYYE